MNLITDVYANLKVSSREYRPDKRRNRKAVGNGSFFPKSAI